VLAITRRIKFLRSAQDDSRCWDCRDYIVTDSVKNKSTTCYMRQVVDVIIWSVYYELTFVLCVLLGRAIT